MIVSACWTCPCTIRQPDAVAMSIEGFRFMPLKAQPPASGLYEVRWVETPAAVDADQVRLMRLRKLSLVALPGCTNLCIGVLESLSAAGLSCVVVDSSWRCSCHSGAVGSGGHAGGAAAACANTAEMLNTVLDILQVQT